MDTHITNNSSSSSDNSSNSNNSNNSSSNSTQQLPQHQHLSPVLTSMSSSSNSSSSVLSPNKIDIHLSPFSVSPMNSSPSIQPKKKTIDDFFIGRVLGEGSYGAVVMGTDKDTNVQYAIKILEKKHIIKENKIKYVQIEKEIFCKSNHPNIVKLFFTFRSDSCLYYVLELCPQGDLLHQLKKVGAFDYTSTQYYTAEIISALEHLHGLGIVHRDLKPENILMSADMHIKLTDFGTGKILDQNTLNNNNNNNNNSAVSSLSNSLNSANSTNTSLNNLSLNENNTTTTTTTTSGTDGNQISNIALAAAAATTAAMSSGPPLMATTDMNNIQNLGALPTRANSFVGTAEYVSPELISNKETSTDSDLWALGCIIYQLSTGRLPFRGKTEFLTFQKVSNRDLVYPKNMNPVVKDLIEKLLVLRPSERLGSLSAGGFENLKKHPFFAGLEWDSLSSKTPPPIKPPADKPAFDDETPDLSSSNNNNGLRSSNNNNSTSSSNSSSNLSSSPVSLNSPSTNSQNHINDKYSKFLEPNESVVKQGLVWKKKGLSIKQRQLILTSSPRLIYVDPKKVQLKGQIPWSDSIKPEIRGSTNFVIYTPKRKYLLEDVDGAPQKWVDAIQSVMTKIKI
ncbi:hypothetical protein CYY_008318 [Polysphondylium violaceum]|uniref:non-specific serine/threonine protein kinase n=1 Tax=Polysphondylium violaceum TaxID=133409 RepID=A0A8J4PLU8_9MYCE|nr:hypothetical protein CYY_008318 [Polysphondylium violaceum]